MLVTMATYGGFAAGIRRAPITIDTADLSAGAAAELQRLVAAARAEAPSQAAPAGRTRDAMSYTVTVAASGVPPFVLRGSDTELSPALAAVIDFLQRHATTGSGDGSGASAR